MKREIILILVFVLTGYAKAAKLPIDTQIKLWVPADAYVIANGQAQLGSGENRAFVVPIPPGEEKTVKFDVYFIDERGDVQTHSRSITVEAGSRDNDLIFDESEFRPYVSESTRAYLELHIPDTLCKIYIDDNETFSYGTFRRFLISNLRPGKTRELAVRITKQMGDKLISQNKVITVIAGTSARVEFKSPAGNDRASSQAPRR